MGSFSSTTHGPFVLRTSTVKLGKKTYKKTDLKILLRKHTVDVYKKLFNFFSTSEHFYCVIILVITLACTSIEMQQENTTLFTLRE